MNLGEANDHGKLSILVTILENNYHSIWNGKFRGEKSLREALHPLLKYGKCVRNEVNDIRNDQKGLRNEWKTILNGEATFRKYEESIRKSVSPSPNGNIAFLERNAYVYNGFSATIDSMFYFYNNETNQLDHVVDPAGSPTGSDIESNQSAGNYNYDLEGNLTSDIKEGISNISWTHDGKVAEVTRSGAGPGTAGTTEYEYDAMRHRSVKTDSETGEEASSQYYVRDAGGNAIAVYTLQNIVEELEYGSIGGKFCYSFVVHCIGSLNTTSHTAEGCVDTFAFNSTTRELTFTIKVPTCFDGLDTCYKEVTINVDSIPVQLANISCDSDYDGWITALNYEQPEEAYKELRLAEYNIYGSEGHGRFVTWKPDSLVSTTAIDSYAQYGTDSVYYYREKTQIPRIIGEKEYEVKDHLGNVRMTFSDIKSPNDPYDLSLGFQLNLLNVNNFYPFGMQMPDRTWSESSDYRYGFQGQEQDDEVYGKGNSTTAEFWQYDARLGRRWNVDPRPVTSLSSYATFSNNPSVYSDIKGDTATVTGGESEIAYTNPITGEMKNGTIQSAFLDLLSSLTDNKYDIDENNHLIKTESRDPDAFSAGSQLLSDYIDDMINNETNIPMELVLFDPKVLIDSYDTGQIDVGDLLILNNNYFQGGQIAHIIGERLNHPGDYNINKNRNSANFDIAHNEYGLVYEMNVIGDFFGEKPIGIKQYDPPAIYNDLNTGFKYTVTQSRVKLENGITVEFEYYVYKIEANSPNGPVSRNTGVIYEPRDKKGLKKGKTLRMKIIRD